MKETGPRQDVGAARYPADPDAPVGQAAQPAERRAMVEERGIAAGAHEKRIEMNLVADTMVGQDDKAVGGMDRRAVERDVTPGIKLPPGEAVRSPQRLHGDRKRTRLKPSH